ncbi:MAG: Nif3-like dinuclear metal center hexameric protein, partial [Desulfomonilaceae bacterium]
MIPTLLQVQEVAETLFPFRYVEAWDNSGIQIGDLERKIASIAFSLNASIDAVSFAAENRCDLLITHHPVLISPIKRIVTSNHVGKIIFAAIKANVDVMSLHTNLDAAQGGLNDFLAEKLQLVSAEIPGDAPCARFGRLPISKSVSELADFICQKLELPSVRVVGPSQKKVESIFLVCGSGMA